MQRDTESKQAALVEHDSLAADLAQLRQENIQLQAAIADDDQSTTIDALQSQLREISSSSSSEIGRLNKTVEEQQQQMEQQLQQIETLTVTVESKQTELIAASELIAQVTALETELSVSNPIL